MNEVSTLMNQYWVCKDQDKEQYYKVKRDIPKFQKFIREQLGWRLIQTENLIKLEKIPAHAESFMGIQEFTELQDYSILCVVLMYLEDKEEQEQFLLSELITFVETCLKPHMEIDWTSFSQRKSLVRVLQFVEKLGMLKVYDGSSESFGSGQRQEVLYENTGYSRYFASGFLTDISEFQSWKDFETMLPEHVDRDKGAARINRVYRQLVTCPAYYWDTATDPDALYLKNQRQWISRYLQDNLGGRLDLHRNAAFWILEEKDSIGKYHPGETMLSEIVLLICGEIRRMTEENLLLRMENDCICMAGSDFEELVLRCREEWKEAWSKEYREMEKGQLVRNILRYMQSWMMLRKEEGQVILLPGAAKHAGRYPEDFQPESVKRESRS